MCELFAMSAGTATNVNFSFAEFSRRGASDARNPDGWGVAYFDGADVRLVREPEPTDNSACARFLMETSIESNLVVSHVRRATQGKRGLANTQPFARELGGRMHVFAHNGNLKGIDKPRRSSCYQPIGDTDSELAFCALLADLEAAWRRRDAPPSLAERFEIVTELAARLRDLGPANFLYSDGDVLFAHAHRRTQPGTSCIEPPGLHLLTRTCAAPTCPDLGAGLDIDPVQRVLLFASLPLTKEGWVPLDEGEVIAAGHGVLLSSSSDRALERAAIAG